MTSHISIVLEQKTIIFQNIGGHCPQHPKYLPLLYLYYSEIIMDVIK